MEETIDIKKLRIRNFLKYLIITILFNPLVLMLLGLELLIISPDKFRLIFSMLTTISIILTIIIPIKLSKLRNKSEIGSIAFIFIFILWFIPFLLALFASGSCTLSGGNLM